MVVRNSYQIWKISLEKTTVFIISRGIAGIGNETFHRKINRLGTISQVMALIQVPFLFFGV